MEKDAYADLTWEDLEHWAGTTIVSRGRTYQRNNSVSELGITPEGALIAYVLGSKRYVTQVAIQDGDLTSECTCPYWTTCKHAVAVVLEYLMCLKNDGAVPQIPQTDSRLDILRETETPTGEYWNPELGMGTDVEEQPKAEQQQNTEPLLTYLEKQTKAQLVELLGELTNAFPDVREFLEDRRKVRSGNASTLLKAIRQEIVDIREPDWDHYNYRRYQTANFDRLHAYLQALLQEGQADEIVYLGKELIGAVTFAVEMYDREGEMIDKVKPSIETVIQALTISSLPSSEQLAWVVDIALADDYDLCTDALETFWNDRQKKSDWSELADELQKRLNNIPMSKDADGDISTYRRDQLSNWLISALECAGREAEILPLCEQEAEITGDNERLIDRLIAENRFEDAENWCHRAIANTDPNHPGTLSALKDRLRIIREKTGDLLGAAAFRADNFFRRPSLLTFQELCKSAQKAKVGPAVEAWARYFLETGHLPRTKGRKRKGEPDDKWPLPSTGFHEDIRPSEGPVTHTLIEIAIAEKQIEAVLKWYDLETSRTDYRWGHMPASSLQIAEMVKEKYPDRTIEIWKEMAESEISRVEVSGYREAGTYLREVRDTLKRLNKEDEWEAYLSELRDQNKRRPRCLEVLDGLAGKRIIDRE